MHELPGCCQRATAPVPSQSPSSLVSTAADGRKKPIKYFAMIAAAAHLGTHGCGWVIAHHAISYKQSTSVEAKRGRARFRRGGPPCHGDGGRWATDGCAGRVPRGGRPAWGNRSGPPLGW